MSPSDPRMGPTAVTDHILLHSVNGGNDAQRGAMMCLESKGKPGSGLWTLKSATHACPAGSQWAH